MDKELGRIFSELERLGIYDNTLIIVTSDHGEEFAEKGFYVGHSRTLHYPVVHVPLFIRYPEGQWGGSRVEDPVSIRDVPATVLRAIGIADHTMPGEALQRYTMDSTEPEGTRPPEFVLAEVTDRAWVADTSRAVGGVERSGTAGNDPTFRNHMIALFQGAHQYIRSADGTEQLYDLDQDRWGQRDLASDTTFREYLARFREATDSIAVDYFQRRPVIR